MSEAADTAAGRESAARIESAEHLRFLAEASEILSASLDYETALERIAHLTVPILADWCVVDLLGDDGLLHRLAVVHRDPAKAEAALELKRRYGVIGPDRHHTAWAVLPGGPPWFDSAVTESRFVSEARDTEHLHLLRSLGFAAEMVLPLVARGRPLGVITLVLAEGSRLYGPEDLALAEELARRAAVAIDNARLFADAHAAETRYRALFDGLADAVLVTDGEGCIQDVNAAVVELIGSGRSELVGCRLAEFVASVDGTAGERAWPPLHDGWRGSLELQRGDGSFIPVDARTTAVAVPTGTVSLVVVRDISERHRAEIDRQRLAAIVESSNDAIIGKTLDGVVTNWNPAAERLYGYSADEMIGRSLLQIFPPDRVDELWSLMDRVRQGKRIEHHDTIRVAKDGRRIDVSVSISPISDAAGRLVGAATIARDVTERKQLEAAQRDFLAMVSHDLRSPLTIIRGNAQLLHRSGTFREAPVNAILGQADRMASLIEDLTDVVRLEDGHLLLRCEPVDLVELARAAVAAASELSSRHAILVEATDAEIIGEWDRARLLQVLENLLGNAIKHGPQGGEITVCVGRNGSQAVVSVRDTGPGIDIEHVPRLFNRFYQASASAAAGLGLGLYISRILVEAHGGRITAESGVGRGSTFTVVLPLTC